MTGLPELRGFGRASHFPSPGADMLSTRTTTSKSTDQRRVRSARSTLQGRDLLEPGTGKMKVSVACKSHVSLPAFGRTAL